MSFRAKASAIVLTAATCMLLGPAAMASPRGPVQVTGKQLESALLPALDFVAGDKSSGKLDSGGQLEQGAVHHLPSLSCQAFWLDIGIPYVGSGFATTAYAGDLVTSASDSVSEFELFGQAVYQFASTHAASSFFGQLKAKYRSCPSVSEPDTKGGTLRWKVHSRSTRHVGGHQALQLVEYLTDSTVPGTPQVIDVLWTTDGTDIYMLSCQPISVNSPRPTLSSLTLKLIARVGALR